MMNALQVSWVRRRDWHIMSNGEQIFTSDDRYIFSWQIKSTQTKHITNLNTQTKHITNLNTHTKHITNLNTHTKQITNLNTHTKHITHFNTCIIVNDRKK